MDVHSQTDARLYILYTSDKENIELDTTLKTKKLKLIQHKKATLVMIVLQEQGR